jgi:MinD superfamily P-loop ATPase
MRSFAIASGKGGTGKTTLTAVFALLARDCGGVIVADCDVEASNLPIALDARLDSVTPYEGGAVAVISPRACMGCGACANLCRAGAIRPPDLDAPVPTIAYDVESLRCEGCGACLLAGCPNGAIALQDVTVGEVRTGHASSGPIVWGRLEPGQDLSGRLVAEVREAARLTASSEDAPLLLIDGPPGVGCPFLSAVAGADGLLAVAEPSVSGTSDLARLLTVARRLDLDTHVVLNKSDLSDDGADLLRSLCRDQGVPVVAEIPFDEMLATFPQYLAAHGGLVDVRGLAGRSFGMAAAVYAWESLELCEVRSSH